MINVIESMMMTEAESGRGFPHEEPAIQNNHGRGLLNETVGRYSEVSVSTNLRRAWPIPPPSFVPV